MVLALAAGVMAVKGDPTGVGFKRAHLRESVG